MASRSNEIPKLYGHGARDIRRVDAGYRPKPGENDKKPNRFESFFLSILHKLLPISNDDYLTYKPPKGNPESY